MIVGQPILFEVRTKLRIPLASASLQAGFPSPAEDHMENSLDLNEHLVSNPGDLRLAGVELLVANAK